MKTNKRSLISIIVDVVQTICDELVEWLSNSPITEERRDCDIMEKPIIEEVGLPLDTYLIKENVIERIWKEYIEHGQLIVAYDYDSTVCPSQDGNESCDQVIELLHQCSKIRDIKMICFTARNPSDYNDVKKYLSEHDIRWDKVNENIDNVKKIFSDHGKIFYNIFLDDRAGLASAYETLVEFINRYYDYKSQ